MHRGCRLTPPSFALRAGFAGLSMLVVSGVTLAWDTAVLQWGGSIRSRGLTEAMLVVTFIGDGLVKVPFALGIAALLWARAARRAALAVILGGVTGELVYLAAKASFQRARPEVIERLSGAGWYSYPSGHVMMGTILLALPLLLLARSLPPRQRWLPVLLAVTLPTAIAASRVYLGVHYPSDVLGALALGAAWVLLWLDWSSASPTSRSAATM